VLGVVAISTGTDPIRLPPLAVLAIAVQRALAWQYLAASDMQVPQRASSAADLSANKLAGVAAAV
jgi:hypothetical protein